MTILVVPHLKCNLKCQYCFAERYESIENKQYDLELMLNKMDEISKNHKNNGFCMHGGECTLINRQDFESLLKKMYDIQGYSALQTNGYQLDDGLIEIYKKYKTNIGISIDGNGSLNSLRGFPDKKRNIEYTNQVLKNIKKLNNENIPTSIIIVLTKNNAGSLSKLNRLVKFIDLLKSDYGISGGRLNFMWTNDESLKKYELTSEEASVAWCYLYKNIKNNWQPFREFTDNLLGFGHSSCSFGKCDYFCTITQVILGDGSLGNCDRTHQEGCVYTRADEPTYDRYERLRDTDCKECPFWNVCYGGCPSEGVNGDWRNKTRFCGAIYNLYSMIAADIKNLMPNIQLVPEYKFVEDYFDIRIRGGHTEPFEKMFWNKHFIPSTWRPINIKKCDDKHTDVMI